MPRRPPVLIAILIVAIVVAVGSGIHEWLLPSPASPPRTGEAITGRPRVVDGDSLELAGHRIRLFGIDAPESRQNCRDRRGQSYSCGREARDALAAIIGRSSVSCAPVGESYDRDVAICTAGGRDLGDVMVRNGHALEL